MFGSARHGLLIPGVGKWVGGYMTIWL